MEPEKKKTAEPDDNASLTDEEAATVVGGIQSKDFFSEIADIIAQVPSVTPQETTPAPKPWL